MFIYQKCTFVSALGCGYTAHFAQLAACEQIHLVGNWDEGGRSKSAQNKGLFSCWL